MPATLSSLLLFSYITCETIRINYAYYVFHAYQTLSPSAVSLLSELAKLLTALAVVLSPFSNDSTINKVSQYWIWMRRRSLGYALPAALYLINNLIYMTILPLTSPSLLQVCVLAKLPATGILHHYMVRRQENMFAWTSLFVLCVGLVIFNILGDVPQSPTASGWYLAPIAGAVIAALSAIASISSERLVKDGDFWMAQAGLYTWGVIFSVLSIPVMELFGHTATSSKTVTIPITADYLIASSMLIFITAGTGLVVASLLRFRDNILKVISTSATLVTVAASQYVLMPELRASNFTPLKVCGASTVAVCTWCYNHWNQAPWPPVQPAGYAQVDSERGESFDSRESSKYEKLKVPYMVTPSPETSVFDPDATKILCCALVIGFVTMEMTWRM